jgi:hypothetical protein
MMTRAHRQEALSRAYVQAVAAQAGLLWGKTDLDYGIDLSLRSVGIQANRRRDAGVQIDLQLRSTTRAAVLETEVRYDLDVQTYNDLRDENCRCPRLLVVFIMPAEEDRWLSQTQEELTLRHCAYWLALKGYPSTTATSTLRIAIPLTNNFSVEAVTHLLQRQA